MAEATRISVNDARERIKSGDARLICAYDDEEQCAKKHLEGAESFTSFESQLDAVPKEAELIFY